MQINFYFTNWYIIKNRNTKDQKTSTLKYSTMSTKNKNKESTKLIKHGFMREILTGRDALSQEDPPPPQEEDKGPLTKDTLAEEEDEPTETEDNLNATENNPSEEKELSIDSVETPR